MLHELKIDQQYLDAILDGSKNFEIRNNDRGYQKGDVIKFHDPSCVNAVNCRSYHFEITYVHSGLGMAQNYVALSIKSIAWRQA